MEIGSRNINTDLFFVVEEGQFNLGDFDQALRMIELVAKTGADAIEFQLAYADDFYIKEEPGYEIYKEREFTDGQLKELVDFSKSKNLEFIATCLSHNLVKKMAEFGASSFNLNASDINNPMIVDAVVATQVPFFVSMPLATMSEIDWVVNRIAGINELANFALLHGQHPMASGKEFVELEDTSLGFVKAAAEKYQKPVGFIDHTPFYWTPAIAVAAGAKIITKHMTMSHEYKGPDYAICLDPDEMQRSVKLAREAYHSTFVKSKELAKGEDLDRVVMRRSTVSARRINEGHELTEADIVFKRPGSGISPDKADSVIGKIAKMDIEEDVLISYKMLS